VCQLLQRQQRHHLLALQRRQLAAQLLQAADKASSRQREVCLRVCAASAAVAGRQSRQMHSYHVNI
jgi:hypothetical protein